MLCVHNKNHYFVVGLMLAAFSGIMLFGFAQAANAQGRGSGHREFMDSRYHHNRSYPARGHFVNSLPRSPHVVTHGNSRYYFSGGVWYRPYGSYFSVVAPPFGLIVPFLPLYHTTLWVGGMPYYYANDVYYTQSSGGYMVVEKPKGEVVEAPAPEEKLFIYPRKGQTEKQQATDRYECHRWAVDQTGYDPIQPPGREPDAQSSQRHIEYQRAMGACLDARGYTVK